MPIMGESLVLKEVWSVQDYKSPLKQIQGNDGFYCFIKDHFCSEQVPMGIKV